MKKAFTFVELLIVSAILILISTSSVFYFFGFLDQTKLNNGIDYIKDELKLLDNKVKNKDLLDYKVFFKKDSLYYIASENNIDLNNLLVFTGTLTDLETGTGKIYLEPSGNADEALKLTIFANEKKLEELIVAGNEEIEYDFQKFIKNKITGAYSGEILNIVEVNYFAESNTDKKKEDYLKLVKIDTDKSTNLDSIYIRNILGRKKFSDDPNSTKLYLTFDVNGKEKTLVINN